MTSRDVQRPGAPARRAYLHIGEPKTGTTFIQDALWANRARLAAGGVQLPGYNPLDHSRASRDLRETRRPADDPADPWNGEWDVLIGEAARVPGQSVISNELLVAAHPVQARRALRMLGAAELHIVMTLRDLGTVLPAEWQEAVKCRDTATWDEWFSEVRAAATAPDRRRRSWFWRVHDTLANLAMWTELVPPERVHIITVPPQKAPELLWARFASVVGFSPDGCDLSSARHNSSLGIAETEFLRRMNQKLPATVPDWFYTREIKQLLAHGVLSTRPQSARLMLTPAQRRWASEQADLIIAGLRDGGYDIVGDLAELRPATGSDAGLAVVVSEAGPAAVAGEPAPTTAAPSSSPADQQLEAAILAAAALGARCYEALYPADGPPRSRRSARRLASDVKWIALNGKHTRRVLRRASGHASVRRVRVLIWSVLMQPGKAVQAPAQAGARAAMTDRQLTPPMPVVPMVRIPVPPELLPGAEGPAPATDVPLVSREAARGARRDLD